MLNQDSKIRGAHNHLFITIPKEIRTDSQFHEELFRVGKAIEIIYDTTNEQIVIRPKKKKDEPKKEESISSPRDVKKGGTSQ